MAASAPVVASLLGNEDVRRHLLALAERDELHHCLLFEGPPGLGKAASALWLAQAINCEAADPDRRPCGTCWSCRSIATDQHPDIIRLGIEPGRATPIISVRQTRELISGLRLRPYRARRRLIIIDPAEAMKAEAANAMLKTFEEPPQDTGFILVCASARRLLTTVRSRSQRIRFRPVDRLELTTWLREQSIEEPEWLAQMADGCPGQALALAGGAARQWRESRDELLRALTGSIEDRFQYTHAMASARAGRAEWRVRAEVIFDALQRLSRDAMAYQSGVTPERLYNTDRIDVVATWSDQLGFSGCQRVGQAIDRARQEMAANVNSRLMLDTLLNAIAAELGR